METTKHILPPNIAKFFEDLSDYLETKPLFFGSIQRYDYMPGISDIDVDIFTYNEQSTLVKMQHFLNIKKHRFKKFVWKLNHNNRLAHGYKVMYKNFEDNFSVEFSIYNEKFREDVLIQHQAKLVLPWYISILLIILKMLHYKLQFISRDTFKYLKQKVMSVCIGLPDDEFIVLDVKK